MDLRRQYRNLLKLYGLQHWWPITTIDGRRLPPPNPMTEAAAVEIAVGAILTQNTAWGNVEKALINLKRAGLLSLPSILTTRSSLLARVIKPSGYYNQKAIKLKAFAAFVAARGRGKLLTLTREPTMALRQELLHVHGLGPETADCILLYAIGKPVFAIDAYTKRWLAEKGITCKRYEDYRQLFEKRLPRNVALYKQFHALLVAWGKEKRVTGYARRSSATP